MFKRFVQGEMAKTGLVTADVVSLLHKRLHGRTKAALALELGISPQYLHDVLIYNRAPGRKILKALSLKREIVYAQDKQEEL